MPKKIKTVEPISIELDVTEYRAALSCEVEGERYHIWLDPKTLKPKDNILYKNPPVDAPKEDQFDTRLLEQDRGVGAVIVPIMLAQVEALLPGARAKMEYEKAEGEAYNEYYQRKEAVKEAGEDLLVVCKEALDALRAESEKMREWHAPLRGRIEAAIAKAEPWRK